MWAHSTPSKHSSSCFYPTSFFFFGYNRLLDIIHEENKLFLVFEFLDLDLKKYMDTVPTTTVTGLPLDQVKVHMPQGSRI